MNAVHARASGWLLAIALATILALVVASLKVGTQEPLPAVALGASWLLHVERVVAAALAISAVATLALRSAYGQLPLKLGATSIEFESPSSTTAGLEELGMDIEALWTHIDKLEGRS